MTEIEMADPQAAQLDPEALAQHGELVELELYYRRRQLFSDPGARKVLVGFGQPVEQTLEGNRQDPYNGAVIYNPTPATLSIGFEAGTGYLAPATVPPFSFATFTERFTNLSIATLNPADQIATIANPVTVLRTRVPPAPAAGPFGAGGGPLTSIPAGAAALATGAVLDNGTPMTYHSLAIAVAGAATAGAVTLDLSNDGQTWLASTATGGLTSTLSQFGPAAARYVRARISTAYVGGTVQAIVASSG